MHRLQAIYVDLSHFKWYADLYLFVRSQASDWLLVVFTVPVKLAGCRTGILWDGLGGRWWIGFLIPVHIAASVSFVPFIRSIASLVVCRFSWASWRGGLDLPFRMPWIVASLAPCTVGETQPGFGCQSPLVASGAKQLSATGG
jgi:hypothetical protein